MRYGSDAPPNLNDLATISHWQAMRNSFALCNSGVPIVDQNRRPSLYLEERCEGLARVLDFFLAPHRSRAPGPKEMLIVFLSQLGFWEWELDNLIYAFTTFDERATAWEHEMVSAWPTPCARKAFGCRQRPSRT
jgi:hypothetical protein